MRTATAGYPPLSLTAAEQRELAARYGIDTVAEALAYDCFADAMALRRQLAHEAGTDITLVDYSHIHPYQHGSNERIEQSAEVLASTGCNGAARLQHICVIHADSMVSRRCMSLNARGDCVAMGATGRFGVPPGWIAEDKLTRAAPGTSKLRTRFVGPNGESGLVVSRFDGMTLHIDKAYKSTLPSRLIGVPGFDRSIATMHYMTARSCRILGVTAYNLQQIKINRLQHRPTLAHLDWLMRNHPGKTMAELIDHTTWAKSAIRQTGKIVGRRIAPGPSIDLEGSPNWQAAHPGAAWRNWTYLQSETERLTLKHLTGQKIDKVSDDTHAWKASAVAALARYKSAQCHGLSPENAAKRRHEIDTLLLARLAAIDAEDASLRCRYGMPPDRVPAQINFDVTYRTIALKA